MRYCCPTNNHQAEAFLEKPVAYPVPSSFAEVSPAPLGMINHGSPIAAGDECDVFKPVDALVRGQPEAPREDVLSMLVDMASGS
jgi:hypothetical protein